MTIHVFSNGHNTFIRRYLFLPGTIANELRVAVVSSTPYMPPWNEGVRNLIRRLSAEFNARNIRISIYSPLGQQKDTTGDWGENIYNVSPLHLHKQAFYHFGRFALWLNTAHRIREHQRQIDVVFFIATLTSATGIRTLLFKALVKKPLVLYVTGLGHPTSGHSIGQCADEIFVGSTFLHRWLPRAKTLYPFLPVDFKRPSLSKNPPDDRFSILFLGSFEPERGVEHLLHAVAITRRKTLHKITLCLAWNGHGASNEVTILKLIDHLKIGDMVTIKGNVNSTPALYSENHLVVIPRVSEQRMSFPVRLLEACTMGKPVIVSNICEMDTIVSGWGLSVPPKDSKALADAILKFIEEPSLYSKCVQGCADAQIRFDTKHTIDMLIATFRKVTNNGSICSKILQ